jgi:Protein of unknown function (DUF4043)
MAATSFNSAITTGSPADQINYGSGEITLGAQLQDVFGPFTAEAKDGEQSGGIVTKLNFQSKEGSTMKCRFMNYRHNPTLQRQPVFGQGDGVSIAETELTLDLVTIPHHVGFVPDMTWRTNVDIVAAHKRQLVYSIAAYYGRTIWYHLSAAMVDPFKYAAGTTELLTAKADYLQQVGNNAIIPYDSTSHYVVGDGFTTTETGVGSTDKLSYEVIRTLEERASDLFARNTTIQPVNTPYDSMPKFVLFTDLVGYSQLQTEYSTTAPAHLNLDLARQQGGASRDESTLAKIQFFTIADTLVVRIPWRTYGMNGSTPLANVRRAVFCGARALHVGFAADWNANRWSYKEAELMEDRTIAAYTGWGCKRVVPTATADFPAEQSYGSILVSHYAP